MARPHAPEATPAPEDPEYNRQRIADLDRKFAKALAERDAKRRRAKASWWGRVLDALGFSFWSTADWLGRTILFLAAASPFIAAAFALGWFATKESADPAALHLSPHPTREELPRSYFEGQYVPCEKEAYGSETATVIVDTCDGTTAVTDPTGPAQPSRPAAPLPAPSAPPPVD